ncbi:MAG: glutamate synthase [Thaumarchaeota archaeon]|nr:glutamate synthase [Nitrososphaerota archaeon]
MNLFPDTDPYVKDDCGVFGVIRKENSSQIPSSVAVKAIECVRFRGSPFGAGFANFYTDGGKKNQYNVRAFVDGNETARMMKKRLESYRGITIDSEDHRRFSDKAFGIWNAKVDSTSDRTLALAINKINAEVLAEGVIKGRIFSFGKHVEVYKEVGYPIDVAKQYGLLENEAFGDMWIAHTRQPTNSPGAFPIWSHPFASFETAIVHNGDISSFGANLQFLKSRGVGSLVGTDSEVIAYIIDHLVRVRGLTMQQVGLILSNPYEYYIDIVGGRSLASSIRKLALAYRGSQLDGPFTVIAGYCDGDDNYMLGLIDRSKFRPIIVGEDDERIYMASEECQIRRLSPDARIWTPEPGRYVLASMKKGIIESGRSDREYFFPSSGSALVSISQERTVSELINANGIDYHELNKIILNRLGSDGKEVHVVNVSGQRYMGVNMLAGSKLVIYGTPGNCLGNFNNGGEIVVHGNGEDDIGDAMYSGKIVIHGDARDVMGQALQGGSIFVRGNAGNRAVIQMREYRDRKPYVIIGGRVDDYFGEYMAGGVAVVLGLGAFDKHHNGQPVGNFVATGMLGGEIYIRGEVRKNSLGLVPPKIDVLNYLEFQMIEGRLDSEVFKRIAANDEISMDYLKAELPSELVAKVARFYEGKYTLPLSVEYRELSDNDKKLLEPKLREFFTEFKLSESILQKVLKSKFTRITPRAKVPAPEAPPPQAEE